MKTKPPKILIVDDDSDMQIFLSNLLESGGFSPILAGNSDDSLKSALKEKPELIILDVPMPGKKGIRIHNDLKHDSRFKNIPVIMISTLERKTLLQYQRSMNFFKGKEAVEPDAYLKKPLETEEFLTTVKNMVTKSDKSIPLPS